MFYHFTVMFNPAFHAAILNKPLIDSSFISIKHFHKIPTGSPPAGALNAGGI